MEITHFGEFTLICCSLDYKRKQDKSSEDLRNF